MERSKRYIMYGIQLVTTTSLLSLVCATRSDLPAGDTIGQWTWFDKTAVAVVLCTLLFVVLWRKRILLSLASVVSSSLIVLGFIEAIWGLRQLYGFAASGHSLFALTGSFFNPGPYSGYLAMILPVCLYQWLVCKKREGILR